MANKLIIPGPKEIEIEKIPQITAGVVKDIDGADVLTSDSLKLEGDDKVTVRAGINAALLQGFTAAQLTPEVWRKVKNIPITQGHGGRWSVIATETNEVYFRGEPDKEGLNYFINGQESDERIDQYVKITMPNETNGKVVKEIHTGHFSAFILYTDGSVYCWGRGSDGELGNGATAHTFVISKIPVANITKLVVASGAKAANVAVYALTVDNDLYAWGYNISGNLGIGNSIDQSLPVLVSVDGGKDVQNIFAIGDTSARAFAITTDEMVYATGGNGAGQLGVGDIIGRNVFTEIVALSGKTITDIQMTNGFFDVIEFPRQNTLFLTSIGEVYGTGLNTAGSLGLGDSVQRTSPVIQSFNFVANPAAKLYADHGGHHGYFIVDNGGLYSWGSNAYGNLGVGDLVNRDVPTFVASNIKLLHIITNGREDSRDWGALIIDTSDVLFVFGGNTNSQLGLGDTVTPVTSPVELPFKDADLIKTIYSNGSNQLIITLVLLTDGRLYGWGNNDDRALIASGGSGLSQKPTLLSV